MMYPKMGEVESASHEQLARWSRFLPSPGIGSIDDPNAEEVRIEENEILKKILLGLNEAGGWNPALSKRIGW